MRERVCVTECEREGLRECERECAWERKSVRVYVREIVCERECV